VKKIPGILCILLITLQFSYSQNPLIKNYTIKDGLPTNTIYYAYGDTKNFIWFATDAGVVRYDGNEFKNYTIKDGLNDNEVIRIKQDSMGRIWFFNLNGSLNYFFNNTIFNEHNSDLLKQIHSDYQIHSFFEDKDSRLYFYNLMHDFYIVNPDHSVDTISLELMSKDIKYLKGLRQNQANNPLDFSSYMGRSLLYFNKSTSNEFLVWTESLLFKYDDLNSEPSIEAYIDKTRRIFPTDTKRCFVFNRLNELIIYNETSVEDKFKLNIGTELINDIFIDKDEVIWIVTYDQGVFCVQNKKITNHFNIEEAQSIFQDIWGNIWITSMKSGIFKINPNYSSITHISTSNFSEKAITAIEKSNLNGIWCTDGDEIYLVRRNEIITLPYGCGCQNIGNILQLQDGKLIINGDIHCLSYINDISISQFTNNITYKRVITQSDYINKKIITNKNQTILCGYSTRFIYEYPHSDLNRIHIAKTDGRINNIYFNTHNELIINSHINYILLIDTIIPYKPLQQINGQIISSQSIYNDSCEFLNIGGNHILLQYNEKLYDLSSKLSYTPPYPYKQLVSYNSKLFLHTTKKIYFINNPLSIINGDKIILESLDIEFDNINDILINHDTLFIASNDGLTIIPINILIKHEVCPPKSYINKILINDQEVNIASKSISYKGNNKLSVHYSGINYSSYPLQYFYKMEGIDDDWIEGNELNVVYQNLPPGNYVFNLKSKLDNTGDGPITKLLIKVIPSIFQRYITWIGIVSLLLLFIFSIRVYIKNYQLKQHEMEHQLVSLEHKALQSMMNPHFIFNSLSSIQSYLLQNKSSEAALYLSQFARLIRQNMNSLKSNFISIEDESDRLRNYLDLEKFRMNNKFDYHIEIDEDIDPEEDMIPSMIIQPFVENAIWHGISPLEYNGEINIRFKRPKKKLIHILIEDNGIGLKTAKTYKGQSTGLHMGMNLVRKRLIILGKKYGAKCKFRLQELNPGNINPGTKVILTIPASLPEN